MCVGGSFRRETRLHRVCIELSGIESYCPREERRADCAEWTYSFNADVGTGPSAQNSVSLFPRLLPLSPDPYLTPPSILPVPLKGC